MIAHASSGSLFSHSIGRTEAGVSARTAAVLLAVAVTAVSAQFTMPLPFTKVPFVLTPFAVMLTGAALGSRLGFLAQAIYLALGVAGLPVFAPSVELLPGAARLIGPTGGYLLAYPAAAFLTGWCAERGWDRRYLTSFASMLVGLAVIYAGGVSWLALLPGQSLATAIIGGFLPYIALDLLKAAAAAKILPSVWSVLGRRRG
jgi:biotin transport system substrate-specific component